MNQATALTTIADPFQESRLSPARNVIFSSWFLASVTSECFADHCV